ncbi:hypothetical protein ARSEF4850_008806 [Beauveria asiatica]
MDILYSLKDLPEIVNLLWIVEREDDDDLKLAPEWEQPSRSVDTELPRDIELVICDHQSAAGNTYLAVKWRDFDCPTWELEEDFNLYFNLHFHHQVSLCTYLNFKLYFHHHQFNLSAYIYFKLYCKLYSDLYSYLYSDLYSNIYSGFKLYSKLYFNL